MSEWDGIAGACKAFLDAYYGDPRDADAQVLGSLTHDLRVACDNGVPKPIMVKDGHYAAGDIVWSKRTGKILRVYENFCGDWTRENYSLIRRVHTEACGSFGCLLPSRHNKAMSPYPENHLIEGQVVQSIARYFYADI